MARIDVRFEIDGADVGGGAALRFAVDGAFVHFRVLARRRVDGVDVDDRHRLVEHFGFGFHQFARAPVQRCAL